MRSHFKIPVNAIGVGRRVFIRRPGEKDEAEFMSNLKHSRDFLYPWIINRTSVSFYKSYLLRFEKRDIGYFVCLKKNGKIAGVININEVEKGDDDKATLGFYSFLPYARQGYLSEGLNLVLEEAFNHLGFRCLEANIQSENQASINFVQKHGFRQENFLPRSLLVSGKWLDHDRWALHRDVWLENRNKKDNEKNTYQCLSDRRTG